MTEPTHPHSHGHSPSPGAAHAHHHHGSHAHHGGSGGPLKVSAQATLHCLTGCIIGEVAGLAIGVTLGLPAWQTIALATILAYLSGFTLGVLPVMKSRGTGFWNALRIIWIGEAVSIGVMELVMNLVDYQMGGMAAPTVLSWMFWRGLLFAVPAGFLAAWPVNYWLVSRDLKACH